MRSALINGGDDGEKKKKRKSMGRRVSFAPDNELTTHFFFEKVCKPQSRPNLFLQEPFFVLVPCAVGSLVEEAI